MIKESSSFPCGLPDNAVTLRMKALYNTYRDSVGIDIFCQTVDGAITAVFAGMDGSFSLVCFDGADHKELDAYFEFSGASVFCSDETAKHLKCRKRHISELYELTAEAKLLPADGHGRVADIYSALKKGEDGDITLPPFDFWYTDFCVRFNHGAAEYVSVDGAVAVTGFMTEQGTLITGVAAEPDQRGKGKGSYALKVLISNIRKKHPSSRVFAATQNAAEFYIKNGFEHIGLVAVCEY